MSVIKPIYKPESLSDFISREDFLKLNKKNNLLASIYLIFHLGCLLFLAAGLILSLEKGNYVLSFLFFLTYCTVFNFIGTAGATHEFAHGTVFTNRQINELFFKVFAMLCEHGW